MFFLRIEEFPDVLFLQNLTAGAWNQDTSNVSQRVSSLFELVKAIFFVDSL